MEVKEAWIDTNVILRYLLNDHSEHSPRARALIEAAERGEWCLKIAPHILCETVYILEVKDYTKEEICDALCDFVRIKGIELQGEKEVLEALIEYRDKNVDFSDCLLAVMAKARGESIWTFNRKHFARMNVECGEPPGD